MNELNDLCTKGRAHEFFFSFPAKSIFSREKLRPPTASIYLVLSWAGFSSWYHLYLSSLSLWEGAFSSVTHVWSTSILYHHRGSMWTQNRGLLRGVFSGLPLGLFPCGFQWSACRVMEVFGFLHVVNPSPSPYINIRRWFVFF